MSSSFLFFFIPTDLRAVGQITIIHLLGKQNVHQIACGLCNACSGTEYANYTCFVQEVIVLCRDYTTGTHHDISTAKFFKFFNELWYQGLVSGCKR